MTRPGLVLSRGHFSAAECDELTREVEAAVQRAPYVVPRMRNGKPFSVTCTNMGALGWCADQRSGYHYTPTHPVTGEPWPVIPTMLLALWREFVGELPDGSLAPDCCLVNRYHARSRLGMHRDTDEAARDVSVISVSLGASAVFRVGGLRRSDPSETFVLAAGDVLVLGGESRHMYHGVDRIFGEERVSLTLRKVTQL